MNAIKTWYAMKIEFSSALMKGIKIKIDIPSSKKDYFMVSLKASYTVKGIT